jgi:hypothetical protein
MAAIRRGRACSRSTGPCLNASASDRERRARALPGPRRGGDPLPVLSAIDPELPGIDVKAEGGYVVGPGSRHESGIEYAVLDSAPIALLPAEYVTPLQRANAPRAASPDGVPLDRTGVALHDDETLSPGQRHDRLMRLAARMRYAGMDEREIFASLVSINTHRSQGADPPDDRELAALAQWAGQQAPREVEARAQLDIAMREWTEARQAEAEAEVPREPGWALSLRAAPS